MKKSPHALKRFCERFGEDLMQNILIQVYFFGLRVGLVMHVKRLRSMVWPVSFPGLLENRM